ncbi:zinc finger protein ZFP1 [Trypanosoma grayi]|uniref:zinc finger protein ZFP1 n=1 Tax=Trypanosoma grayi TaxID=71804 RepID=UPI0004F4937E|nr:zinc finger protein ZFP1 [Trypanosoma grayi]KEG06614.1 zinc finger protein ZFP1 [Trypanosoma grayi]
MRTSTNSDTRSESGIFSSSRYGRRGVDHSRYKTRMCRNYTMGVHCPFGERCAFSHGEPEVNQMRVEENELPPPPPYSEAIQAEMVLPPAYPSRFRHDPYSFGGIAFLYSP